MNRCQCGKPTFASVGIRQLANGYWDNFGYHLNPDNCLHFKAADRYCERCGVALCGECEVQLYNISDGIHTGRVSAYTASIETVCRTCARLEE